MPGRPSPSKKFEGDEFRGIVKVRSRPITAQYKGAATFVEQDGNNLPDADVAAEAATTLRAGHAQPPRSPTNERDPVRHRASP